ncbi:unnamed protein product [Acanthoscelides obtectus]|nr:unnamed protein product [Acanthoscelides obtectus]CAH2017632.1 unnamed protein product [Acanthoscelides obtectus]CAK1623336.1 hypothetical protein AOBTE_LOCUS1935 [Acanthoscelides obtectus]CAK1623346.1 hypothetical protein AOBTE_LOCUS1944 [Acanthoscelides obtectus]
MLNLEVSMEDCRLSVRTLDEGPTHDCFKVSKDIVTILNDQKLVDTYISVADLFKDRQLDVMDLTPFPLVGFLLAKNGCRVFHSMRNKLDQDFFDYILRVNSISPERFVMLPEGARCIDPEFVKPNSLILHDVIDTDGYLESNFFRTDSLEPAIVLPVTALAVAMMVYAPYIDCCNKVNDSNTLGFKTAKHMNQYSGDEHPNIEDLVYEQRTERVVFTLEDGVKVMSVTAVNTGLVNAVYYWYEMYYSDKIKFSTLDSSHYKKTCYFMKETKYVTKGENLSIECHVEDSVMKITEGTGQSYSE